ADVEPGIRRDASRERLLRPHVPSVHQRARLTRGADRGAGDAHAAAARRLVRHLRGGGALARPAWTFGADRGAAPAPGPTLIPPPSPSAENAAQIRSRSRD